MSGGPPAPRPEEAAEGRRWRVPLGMSREAIRNIRVLARNGFTVEQICDRAGVTPENARLAMASMRGQREVAANHKSLNVNLRTYRMVRARALPGEAVWQTMERIMDGLQPTQG